MSAVLLADASDAATKGDLVLVWWCLVGVMIVLRFGGSR